MVNSKRFESYDPAGEGGGTATKPANPTKEPRSFLGWFEGESETPFDFSTPINKSLTLTAHWGEPVAHNETKNKDYGTLNAAVDDASDNNTIKLLADIAYTESRQRQLEVRATRGQEAR